MTLAVLDSDDRRHSLNAGEHEAFYFLFTLPDGQAFGFVRTLFSPDSVLEAVALNLHGRTWAYQRLASPLDDQSASGEALRLERRQAWSEWHCRFEGRLADVASGQDATLSLDMHFHALAPPAHYHFGQYHHIQQDGHMRGALVLGDQEYTGDWICSRDRSWGRRPLGGPIQDWVIASSPGQLYLVFATTGAQPVHFGHVEAHPRRLWQSPRVSIEEDAWRIEEAGAPATAWRVRRIAPPLIAYAGPPGQEGVRNAPQAGDLYRDEIGPATYTDQAGREFAGFMDQARRIA